MLNAIGGPNFFFTDDGVIVGGSGGISLSYDGRRVGVRFALEYKGASLPDRTVPGRSFDPNPNSPDQYRGFSETLESDVRLHAGNLSAAMLFRAGRMVDVIISAYLGLGVVVSEAVSRTVQTDEDGNALNDTYSHPWHEVSDVHGEVGGCVGVGIHGRRVSAELLVCGGMSPLGGPEVSVQAGIGGVPYNSGN
jgi:hypothetical protein